MSANRGSLFTSPNNVKSANQMVKEQNKIEEIIKLLKLMQPHDIFTGVNTSNAVAYHAALVNAHAALVNAAKSASKKDKPNITNQRGAISRTAALVASGLQRSSTVKKGISKNPLPRKKVVRACPVRVQNLIIKVIEILHNMSLIHKREGQGVGNNTPKWLQEAKKTLYKDLLHHHIDLLLLAQKHVREGYKSLQMCEYDEGKLKEDVKILTNTTKRLKQTNTAKNYSEHKRPIKKGNRVTNANGTLNGEVMVFLANGVNNVLVNNKTTRLTKHLSVNNIQRKENYNRNKNMSNFLYAAKARL